MGAIHETGHARFEQNLPRVARQADRHGALLWHSRKSEPRVRDAACAQPRISGFAPMLAEHFGDQPAFEAGTLFRLFTRAKPGLIRVHADEVTYSAHIILRYKIERPLIEGEIEAEDVPAMWDKKMESLPGLDARSNFKDGAMQDVHWTDGAFGCFPSYTLGAMYAAQWFAAMRRTHPDLAPVFDWLHANVWSQGSRWEAPALVRRASGEPLNPAYLRAHLETRYLGGK